MREHEVVSAARRLLESNSDSTASRFRYELVSVGLGAVNRAEWSVVFAILTSDGTSDGVELDGPVVVLVDDHTGDARVLAGL